MSEAGFGFLTAAVLGRALGAEQYGIYAFSIAMAGLLMVPALLGYNALSVREVAALREKREWATLASFLSGALRRVLLISALVTVAGLLGFLLMPPAALAAELRSAVLLALVLVPVIALLRLHEAFLRGVGHIGAALMADRGVRPALFFAYTLALLWAVGTPRTGLEAVAVNLAATGTALVVALATWQRLRPAESRVSGRGAPDVSHWRRAAPFAWIAGVSVLSRQTDVVMLGFLSSSEEVGIYRIASRVATLVTFAMLAVAMALGPRIAALHAAERRDEIQNLATKAALASVALAFPLVLVFLLAGHWLLLLFGPDFGQGAPVLATLAMGHLGYALMGHAGLLLSMTRHERTVGKTLGFTALLNMALNGALIPFYGAVGAAIATATSLLVAQGALAFHAYRVLQVHSTLLGLFRR